MRKIGLVLWVAVVTGGFSKPQTSKETYLGKRVSKILKFASPLQSLTLFPKEIPEKTPRDDFIPKFKAIHSAEKKARDIIAAKREASAANDEIIQVGPDWEKRAEDREKFREEMDEKLVNRAVDRALSKFKSQPASSFENKNKFQFVGVIQPPGSRKKVKWYARKRPKYSKWNIRLLHVNKDIIVRDMFVSGEIDIFAKYVNTGKPRDELQEGEDPSAPRRPLIEADYSVKKRTPL